MLTNIFVNSVTLLDKAKGIVEQLLKEVDAEAISLQTYFYEQKDALYQDELRKLEQSLGDATKALKRAYAPLNFSAKVNIDRFEMSWWTRHRRPNGGTVIKKRIPWGMAKSKEHHGYYLPGLLVEAKKWEVDLVKEVEAHAMTLREARTALLELGTKFDVYRRLLDQSDSTLKCAFRHSKAWLRANDMAMDYSDTMDADMMAHSFKTGRNEPGNRANSPSPSPIPPIT